MAGSNTNRVLLEDVSLIPDTSNGEGNEALAEFLEEIKDQNAEVVAPAGEESAESGNETAATEDPPQSAPKPLGPKKTCSNG